MKAKNNDIIEIPIGKLGSKLKSNPWIAITFVLAIVLIVVIAMNWSESSGTTISSEEAASSVLSFVNTNPNLQSAVSIISSEREGQLYKVTISYQDQEVPLYTTLDGKFLISAESLVSISGDATDNTDIEPNGDDRVDVSVDDDAVLGDEDAPITIIEFSDYQCPYCARFYENTLPLIKENYIDTGKVKFIYRDFPLSGHPMAQKSAEAAECAREEGGDEAYWEMHDIMFENQRTLSIENLKKWAKDLGYNIDSCLDDGTYAGEVGKDQQDGETAGITGTPGFFVNGIFVKGALPYESFEQIIEAELETV